MSTTKIILAKPADWDSWISFVRSRATNTRIWDLVDPSKETKPEALTEPIEPIYMVPEDDSLFDKNAYDAYKARKEIYKTKIARYERQEKAFGDLIIFIQDTIAAHNVIYIQKVEPHPWNLLNALKQRIAPSDEARSLELEQKYHQLCKGPLNQNLETWLDEWTTTFTLATEYAIGEVTGTRPIRDFLMAIRHKEPTFADTHLVHLKDKSSGDLYELIEEFRQHIRLIQLSKPSKGEAHSAFATDANNSKATYRGQATSPKPCVCGDTHWFADCPYLVPDQRQKGWKPTQKKHAKVDEALKNDKTKAWVDRSLARHKRTEGKAQEQSSSSKADTPISSADAGSFSCIRTAFSTDSYSLRGSWILDNGSNSHVCNSTMRSRIVRTRDAHGEYLIAGTRKESIEYYGTIKIEIQTPSGIKIMTLLNVAYVPEFMTNIVSQDILYTKGVFFDNWRMHLHQHGNTFSYVERHNGHYLLENNVGKETSEPSTATGELAAFATKTGTTSDWHQILTHASHEAIQHLEESAEGVEVKNNGERAPDATNTTETGSASSPTPEPADLANNPEGPSPQAQASRGDTPIEPSSIESSSDTIVLAKRTRRASVTKASEISASLNTDNILAKGSFYDKDTVKIKEGSTESHRYHRDSLSPEPRFYHEMLKHPHAEGVKRAIQTEVNTLTIKGTWREVPYDHATQAEKTPIPTTKLRHMDIHRHWLRQRFKASESSIRHQLQLL